MSEASDYLKGLDPRDLRIRSLERQAADATAAKRRALDELLAARRQLEDLLAVMEHRELAPIVARSRKRREATAVAMASDWHIEEVVDPESVGGLNEYSPNVARKRAERFWQGVADLVEHHRTGGLKMQITDLVVWLGGDLMNGYIHEEYLAANDMSPPEAQLFLLEVVEPGLRFLLEQLDPRRLLVPCDAGNHGRTGKKKPYSNLRNNYEWAAYHILAQRFRDDPRVQFQVAASPVQYFEVYGQTVRTLHGDDLRFGGGVGGLAIPLAKALARWDRSRQANVTMLGHFHQLLDVGGAMVNGSLIGINSYALGAVQSAAEPPAQWFFLLDKHRGKCMSTPVWV